MKKKGISPLIAAVLLIAFTMAVASIFAQWAPQLIQDAQGDTSDRAQAIQECSDININVVDAASDSATLQQKTGDSAAGNVTVTWFYSDGTSPAQDTVTISSSRGTAVASNSNSAASLDSIEVDLIDCEGAPTSTYEP